MHIFAKKVIRRADIKAASLLETTTTQCMHTFSCAGLYVRLTAFIGSLSDLSGKGRNISDLYLSARISRQGEERAYVQRNLPAMITSSVETAALGADVAELSVAALAPVASASWAFLDKIKFVMNVVDKLSEVSSPEL